MISMIINGITKSDEPLCTTLSRHARDLDPAVYIIKIPAEFHLAGNPEAVSLLDHFLWVIRYTSIYAVAPNSIRTNSS